MSRLPNYTPPPLPPSPQSVLLPDIGNVQLVETRELFNYIDDNKYAMNELISRDVNFIKASINNCLKHIAKYPYVLQVMIPKTPFGKDAWTEVEEEIHNTMPWGDINKYQIIIQDEWFVFIIIQKPSSSCSSS